MYIHSITTMLHALMVEEIMEYVQWFATAAWNTILGAGFDSVKIHGANRYLPDQTNTNKHTDLYGGLVENHTHFVLEITKAVINTVGANKVGIHDTSQPVVHIPR